MLVTSLTSFSHNVFQSPKFQGRKNSGLCGKVLRSLWFDPQAVITLTLLVQYTLPKQEGHDGPVSLHWLILGNLFKT